MGRTIAGEHFYGPKNPDMVDVPPALGAVCVATCRGRDGRDVDFDVVDRAPDATWRHAADEGRRRAWRDACDGRVEVWYRLYGPDLDAADTHRELIAAIRLEIAGSAA